MSPARAPVFLRAPVSGKAKKPEKPELHPVSPAGSPLTIEQRLAALELGFGVGGGIVTIREEQPDGTYKVLSRFHQIDGSKDNTCIDVRGPDTPSARRAADAYREKVEKQRRESRADFLMRQAVEEAVGAVATDIDGQIADMKAAADVTIEPPPPPVDVVVERAHNYGQAKTRKEDED